MSQPAATRVSERRRGHPASPREAAIKAAVARAMARSGGAPLRPPLPLGARCRPWRVTPPPVFEPRDAAVVALERAGRLRWQLVAAPAADALEAAGDRAGARDQRLQLMRAQALVCAQLPLMPRDYVLRVVMDAQHVTLVGLLAAPGRAAEPELVACLTATDAGRLGKTRQPFAEVVFCAVATAHQVHGLGQRLMAQFKTWAQQPTAARAAVRALLVYADNSALGYFARQGFQPIDHADVAEGWLPRAAWDVGFVKHYDAATLMAAPLDPCADYLHFLEHVAAQRTALAARLHPLGAARRVYAGARRTVRPLPLGAPAACAEARALADAGWDAAATGHDWSAAGVAARAADTTGRGLALLAALVHATPADVLAPFAAPVAELYPREADAYARVVRDPMDLRTVRERLARGYYLDLRQVHADLQRMLANCAQYNPPNSWFADAARQLGQCLAAQWPPESAL